MSGYFAVDIRDQDDSNPITDYRFLFKSLGPQGPAELADALTEGLRRVLFPDALVLVCMPGEKESVLQVIANDAGVQQALARASTKVCVAVCEVQSSGVIGAPTFVRNPREHLHLIGSERQSCIFDEGLRALFGVKNVLVEAPAGFTFVKPSQERSTFFLRAEEALFETERVNFLAFTMLRRIAEREKNCQSAIEVIFIDTMAIASLAYVLRQLYAESFGQKTPRVVSFHSYAGIEDIPRPQIGTSLCLISASSSMNMQRKWLEVTRCHPSEVITLLTLKSAKDSSLAMHAFDTAGSAVSNSKPSGLRDLRIVGERFSPEDTPLKQVLLTVLAHKNERWSLRGPEYSREKLFHSMKSVNPSTKVRPIFVDGLRLLEHPYFKDFVAKELKQKVPISVRAVIYQDDEASKLLAERCAEFIKKILHKSKPLPVINSKSIVEESGLIESDNALLIVAAVIGRGAQLLSISRDLRGIHFGARHYLVGFQIADSISDQIQLTANLKFSSKKSSINVSILESMAVGQNVGDAYRDEIQILKQWGGLESFPLISQRLASLENATGDAESPFLPSTVPGQNSLVLRQDFAYWNDGYGHDCDHAAAVLLTAASMLQHARESRKFSDDNHRLSTDTFQQVVLDPENFARYNDGVIQSAILRAAHPSELDYSSHEDASRRIAELLCGVFVQHAREQGEAALEFALALHSKKLRLADTDFASLRRLCATVLADKEGTQHQFLKDLLGIGSADAWRGAPVI